MIRDVYCSSRKVPDILVRFSLYLLDCSRQILEKYSNIKFHENPSSGNRVVPWGRTDGRTDIHDEVKCRSLKFFNRPYKEYKTLDQRRWFVCWYL